MSTTDNVEHVRLALVEGLHCASCVTRAENVLQNTTGVTEAQVNLATKEADITFDNTVTNIAAIKTRLQDGGFTPAEEDEHTIPDYRTTNIPEKRQSLIAIILATPVMVLGMAHWHHPMSWWVQIILTTLIIFWPGRSIFLSALKGLRHAQMGMDTLVAMGVSVAFLLSLSAVFLPQWWPQPLPIYFESAAVIVALVLLGRWLEARARSSTSAAVMALVNRRPPTAQRIIGDTTESVLVGHIVVGDCVRVRTGETIPIDGVIIHGDGHVDEAMITGEALPIAKHQHDHVTGGTVLTDGLLDVRANRVGADTVLAQLIEQVRTAQGAKPPLARLADRISAIFVPIVITIALLTYGIWLLVAPDMLSHALLASVTVLVIACPCALGLATPTAIMVAVGRAAQRGLLIRNGAALEQATHITKLAFDKTGTLTTGKPHVDRVLCEDDISEDVVIRYAALVEKGSEHPLARAIVRAAEERQLDLTGTLTHVHNDAGYGISATIGNENVAVGNARYMRTHAADSKLLNMQLDNTTQVFVARDGHVIGLLALSDVIKPEAKACIDALQQRGISCALLTGDQLASANAIAQQVGITDIHAGLLPADKVTHIQQWQQQQQYVAMVGDGMNDAPALSCANVGIAMATTDAANAIACGAGDIVILSGRTDGVVAIIDLSKATVRTIKQNLAGAFIYNIIAIPIAAGVLFPMTGLLLDPMIAAAAMAASSLTVVGNSLRLGRTLS